MSDYHDGVVCDKCGGGNLKAIAPLKYHFQPHIHCKDCGHDELEVIGFMRWNNARQEKA